MARLATRFEMNRSHVMNDENTKQTDASGTRWTTSTSRSIGENGRPTVQRISNALRTASNGQNQPFKAGGGVPDSTLRCSGISIKVDGRK